MAFLLNLIEFVLLGLVTFDALGFIVQNRKNSEQSSQQDYKRSCFTLVFFFILKALTCSSCTGYIGNFICMLTLLAKAYVSLPILKGTDKLYHLFIEQNAGAAYLKTLVNTIKEKTGNSRPEQHQKDE